MNLLNELYTLSAEDRRLQLAKILALGVIRVLSGQAEQNSDNQVDSPETLSDGLEDS